MKEGSKWKKEALLPALQTSVLFKIEWRNPISERKRPKSCVCIHSDEGRFGFQTLTSLLRYVFH